MTLYCDLQLVFRNLRGEVIARAKATKARTTKRFFHVDPANVTIERPNPSNVRFGPTSKAFSKDTKKPVGWTPLTGAHWAIAEINRAYEA